MALPPLARIRAPACSPTISPMIAPEREEKDRSSAPKESEGAIAAAATARAVSFNISRRDCCAFIIQRTFASQYIHGMRKVKATADVAEALVAAAKRLCDAADRLKFAAPVSHVYN